MQCPVAVSFLKKLFIVFLIYFAYVSINAKCRYEFGLKFPNKCDVISVTESLARLNMVLSVAFTVFNTPLEWASNLLETGIFR